MKHICTYGTSGHEFVVSTHVGRFHVKHNGRLILRASDELTARAYVDGWLTGNDQFNLEQFEKRKSLEKQVKELESKLGVTA